MKLSAPSKHFELKRIYREQSRGNWTSQKILFIYDHTSYSQAEKDFTEHVQIKCRHFIMCNIKCVICKHFNVLFSLSILSLYRNTKFVDMKK